MPFFSIIFKMIGLNGIMVYKIGGFYGINYGCTL